MWDFLGIAEGDFPAAELWLGELSHEQCQSLHANILVAHSMFRPTDYSSITKQLRAFQSLFEIIDMPEIAAKLRRRIQRLATS